VDAIAEASRYQTLNELPEMTSKQWRNLLAFSSIIVLLLVLVWIKSPTGRLTMYEWKGDSRLDQRQRGFRANDIADIAKHNTHPAIQQRAVRLLIEPSAHPSLIQLPAAAFDEYSRAVIHRRVMLPRPDNFDVLLAGLVYDKSSVPRLRKLRMPEAQMALARLGDKAAIKLSVARLLRESEVDEVNAGRIGGLYQQLDYLRQPESVSVLMHYVFSEKRAIICGTGTQHITDTRFEALGAAYILSQSLQDWPRNVNGLDEIRAWIKNQKYIRIRR
jgi:hypothetical protein